MKSFLVTSLTTVFTFWICCLINVNLAWTALGATFTVTIIKVYTSYRRKKDFQPISSFIGWIVGILIALLSWGLIMNP